MKCAIRIQVAWLQDQRRKRKHQLLVPAVRRFLDFLVEYTNGEGLPRVPDAV